MSRSIRRWKNAGKKAAVLFFSAMLSWNTLSAFGAEAEASACAKGPGGQALPYTESYGIYQWAFLNEGILKLVPGNKNTGGHMLEYWAWQEENRRNISPSAQSQDGICAVAGIDIDMIPAWESYAKKSEKRQTVVALIDTGVDYTHPELSGAIWINPGEIPEDGLDNDGNGYVDDCLGWNFYSDNNQVFTGSDDNHGTHSAGTIAAARDGLGTVGICDPSYVKVMVLKTLGTATGVGKASDVIRAIRYAEANGAVICNLSFGTDQYSEELYETMKNSKMLFVVAAGNGDEEGHGYDIDQKPVYPAAFDLDNIISVASLRFDGSLDPASNYGANSVDLEAPGSYILSTTSGGNYSYMSGTSMAAPMVTGAAAMLYSYNNALTTQEVKTRLLTGVRPLETLQGITVTGGMLDIGKALGE